MNSKSHCLDVSLLASRHVNAYIHSQIIHFDFLSHNEISVRVWYRCQKNVLFFAFICNKYHTPGSDLIWLISLIIIYFCMHTKYTVYIFIGIFISKCLLWVVFFIWYLSDKKICLYLRFMEIDKKKWWEQNIFWEIFLYTFHSWISHGLNNCNLKSFKKSGDQSINISFFSLIKWGIDIF